MTIIIGGGILGLLCARRLLELNRPITVLELDRVGRASSWAGGGILSPLYPWRYPAPINALAAWSQRDYPRLTQSLGIETGVDPEWTQSGLLAFGVDDIPKAQEWAAGQNIHLQLKAEDEVRALEPAAGESGQAAWMPDVAQVRNPRLLSALRISVERAGGEIREGVAVTGFEVSRGRLMAVRTAAGDVSTESCVVTAGAWAGHLLETVGLKLPIRPVKGQMLLVRAQPGLVKRILLKGGSYLVPRRDGHVLIGSTLEDAGFDTSITAAARETLWSAALELAPVLAKCPVEQQWAGLRPGSPDGVPFIGEHPEVRGLFVCAGHYRNGIVMAPASARLLTDLMCGKEPPIDPAPYRLGFP